MFGVPSFLQAYVCRLLKIFCTHPVQILLDLICTDHVQASCTACSTAGVSEESAAPSPEPQNPLKSSEVGQPFMLGGPGTAGSAPTAAIQIVSLLIALSMAGPAPPSSR